MLRQRLPMICGLVGLVAVLSLSVLVVAHNMATTSPVQTHHTVSKAGATLAHPTEPTEQGRHATSTATPKPTPVPVLSGWRLQIPAIGVNAPIENVGVASDGTLAVPAKGTPNEWTNVGWYQGGPVPGQRGSAVIDGHLDRPGGSPAVFWYLKNLHLGDTITVTGNGKTVHFRVTQIMWYTPTNAPLRAIFSNNTGTFLNLVTCAGTWIPSQHQTTQRLVVYTTLV